jgi:two-component system chemotaxis response regulator CheY
MAGLDITAYEAGNGLEAAKMAAEIFPDLVITDLNMPEMSGGELVAWLHAAPGLEHVPVLILSADQGQKRSTELLASGAVAYLTKPTTPETLRRSIAGFFGGRI